MFEEKNRVFESKGAPALNTRFKASNTPFMFEHPLQRKRMVKHPLATREVAPYRLRSAVPVVPGHLLSSLLLLSSLKLSDTEVYEPLVRALLGTAIPDAPGNTEGLFGFVDWRPGCRIQRSGSRVWSRSWVEGSELRVDG